MQMYSDVSLFMNQCVRRWMFRSEGTGIKSPKVSLTEHKKRAEVKVTFQSFRYEDYLCRLCKNWY